jgi:hypothetical protein
MKTAEGGPRPYRAATTELADARREARGAADVLDFFAGQLRGEAPDLDGPELTAIPSRSGVLRMLRRIDDARGRLERERERLSDGEREGLPSPDALGDEG